MKARLKIEKEFEVKEIHVRANVRYWEDSTINDVPDENGDIMPFRVGDLWCPVIDIDSGKIKDWPEGTTAEVRYKVVDQCGWGIVDETGEEIITVSDEYVPESLYPKENGYGDYIIMDIDGNGQIQDWNPDIADFIVTED